MAKFKVEVERIQQVLRRLDGMSEEAWYLHKKSIGHGGFNEGKAVGLEDAHDLLLMVLPSKHRP